MKTLKQMLPAIVVGLALSLNTFAGDMSTPGFVPPPPPTLTSIQQGANSTNPFNLTGLALEIWLSLRATF